MLCQFIVKNFKSIRDEVVLDMQATSISEHKESLIIEKDGETFLPISAIYGPNGSGKSNIIEAMSALINKIMKPICSVCDLECDGKNRKALITPFLLDAYSVKNPTEFTIFFRTHKAEYRYILHCLKDNVKYESLDKKNIDGKRYISLFERINGKIELKNSFTKFQLPEDISGNIPFLSYLGITYKKNEIVKDVIGWLEGGVLLTNYGNPFTELKIRIPSEKKETEFVVKMLKEMDIDISGFDIVEGENDDKEVFSKHMIGGKEYPLPIFAESAGTQKILGFLPDILESLFYGRTLFVDELDSKLHPTLIKYIISLFTNKGINKHGAQLIFTSHDLANMNNEIFRRDEIWFVAKNNEQSSELYSLVEIKDSDGLGIRKDSKYSKQYLEGKYGADPYLKRIINWEEV